MAPYDRSAVLRGVQTSQQNDSPDQLKSKFFFYAAVYQNCTGTNCPAFSLSFSLSLAPSLIMTLKSFEHCL